MNKDKPDSPETEPLSTDWSPESREFRMIGPYRILRRLGEGGMGEVYEAEQTEPVRRKVAIKVIRWGMDTKQVVARFKAEEQALALMNHPCIARVYDAGETGRGRPYFAMEYVKGVPITEYCDTHRLNTHERMELFTQVCDGVHHAHQKGIIHRDIKASNVLVKIQDNKPVPKIIDFGVAKATEQKLTEHTIYTEFGQLIGTPEYMSPEQAEMTGLDIDTRTDVYSLGVLLYELLVGVLPFDPKELRRSGFDEIRRKIREEEPPTPSKRLSSLGDASTLTAAKRRVEVLSLARQLKGDLDWIVMMALAKDRTRRYGSGAELAADIHRHLRHEPVVASPPSTTYRVGKFVRRHRVGVVVAAAGLLALLVGLTASTVLYLRAEQQRAIAEAINEFLNNDLLAAVAPEEQGREVTMREVLDATSGSLEGKFPQQPLVEASIRHTLGSTYHSLGEYEPSERHLRVALAVRREQLGEEHPDTLSSMINLADTLRSQGDLAGARELNEEVLDVQRRVLGPEHPDTLSSMGNLASTLWSQGDLAGARELDEEVLDVQRRVLGPEHPDTLISMGNLAATLWSQGDLAGARELNEEVLDVRRRVLGPEHPDTLSSMHNLAVTLWNQGDLAGARELGEEVLDVRRRVLGPEHPDTLSSMGNLAVTLEDQGDLARARELKEEVLDVQRRVLGPEHPNTLMSAANLAVTLEDQGDVAGARELAEEVLDVRRRVLGPEHPDTLHSMGNLAETLREQGQLRRARELLEQALRGFERTLGAKHPSTANVMWELAETLRAEGNDGEAEVLVQRLCWLVESDEKSLSRLERKIRDEVMGSCSPPS